MKRLLCAVCVALAGCSTVREVTRYEVCPPIPASLTAPCATCRPDDPAPVTNGDLMEAWLDCRSCVAEARIKGDAIRALAQCRVERAGE